MIYAHKSRFSALSNVRLCCGVSSDAESLSSPTLKSDSQSTTHMKNTAVLLFLTLCVSVQVLGQTRSIKNNPDWNRDNDWTELAPGEVTVRDAILEHNSTINNRELIINNHIVISDERTLQMNKDITITNGGILEIIGTVQINKEFFMQSNSTLIVCGSLIGTMNNAAIAADSSTIIVCEGGLIDWDGDWYSGPGSMIINDGTIIVEDEFVNGGEIIGGGEIIIEDGPLMNIPPGSIFGCDLPDG